MTFGQRLKEARTQNKLTQRQLADAINAKHNSISDWENDKNKPDPDTIELLCGVLGVTPNYLLNSKSEDFSLFEKNIIKSFRVLDEQGKEIVIDIINREVLRSEELRRLNAYVEKFQELQNQYSHITPIAAHNDYETMDGELEKMKADISKLKRPE